MTIENILQQINTLSIQDNVSARWRNRLEQMREQANDGIRTLTLLKKRVPALSEGAFAEEEKKISAPFINELYNLAGVAADGNDANKKAFQWLMQLEDLYYKAYKATTSSDTIDYARFNLRAFGRFKIEQNGQNTSIKSENGAKILVSPNFCNIQLNSKKNNIEQQLTETAGMLYRYMAPGKKIILSGKYSESVARRMCENHYVNPDKIMIVAQGGQPRPYSEILGETDAAFYRDRSVTHDRTVQKERSDDQDRIVEASLPKQVGTLGAVLRDSTSEVQAAIVSNLVKTDHGKQLLIAALVSLAPDTSAIALTTIKNNISKQPIEQQHEIYSKLSNITRLDLNADTVAVAGNNITAAQLFTRIQHPGVAPAIGDIDAAVNYLRAKNDPTCNFFAEQFVAAKAKFTNGNAKEKATAKKDINILALRVRRVAEHNGNIPLPSEIRQLADLIIFAEQKAHAATASNADASCYDKLRQQTNVLLQPAKDRLKEMIERKVTDPAIKQRILADCQLVQQPPAPQPQAPIPGVQPAFATNRGIKLAQNWQALSDVEIGTKIANIMGSAANTESKIRALQKIYDHFHNNPAYAAPMQAIEQHRAALGNHNFANAPQPPKITI